MLFEYRISWNKNHYFCIFQTCKTLCVSGKIHSPGGICHPENCNSPFCTSNSCFLICARAEGLPCKENLHKKTRVFVAKGHCKL